MSTPTPLTAIQGGITRLRVKGAALKNTLYDMLNCYVTMQGTVKPRGGTIRNASLSNVTKGLLFFEGTFSVFAHTQTDVPDGYACNVLVNPVDSTLALKKIHFASPFMGFPYVVAEFTDGSVYHYWLQTNGAWIADTVHFDGDYVSPTTPNGFAYAATRLAAPNSAWSPDAVIAENDIVEPTTYNGYVFKAIAVAGTTPHTGSIEPAWPAAENAQIQEFGDFGATTSVTTATGSVALQPGTAITDRYGNAAVFQSQLGTEPSTAPSVTAQTTVSTWRAGTLYQPGAVVQPSTGQGAFINAIPNGDFEAGDDGSWLLPSGDNLSIISDSSKTYQGSHCMQCTPNRQTSRAVMNTFGAVTAGQSVTAICYANPNNSGADLTFKLNLVWYDDSDTLISRTQSAGAEGHGYRQITVTGNAPATATRARAELEFATGTVPSFAYADLVSWDLETPAAVSNFLFEAVQASAATSGSAEPAWPTVEGNTVVDGGVTWEAIGTSIITWQALPIMKSGDTEPTWPTSVGLAVADGNMSWVCADRRITDPKCPQSKYVAISSSKIFAGDKDIVAFSATTNPLDWTSPNDAGFLPFGLNNFGAEAVAGLNLYRSNLIIFNGLGYQMWQTDEDPTDMALLDSSPVGCTFSKSIQPVNNDLVFESIVGMRNIGIAGASTNLQAGNFGKAVDPLVKTFRLALTGDQEPLSLFYPGSGQYWCWFGKDVVVLTINGGPSATSWARFRFPYAMTDWTTRDGVLYLRTTDATAGDLVLQYDEGDVESPGTLVDDSGGADIAIDNLMWWAYLDFGPIGLDKTLEGFDIACNGEVTVSFGYNQKDFSKVTDGYVVDGDTMDQAGMVPYPVTAVTLQPRLSFTPGAQWEWQMFNLYVDAMSST